MSEFNYLNAFHPELFLDSFKDVVRFYGALLPEDPVRFDLDLDPDKYL